MSFFFFFLIMLVVLWVFWLFWRFLGYFGLLEGFFLVIWYFVGILIILELLDVF
jgi:hypothetical protein